MALRRPVCAKVPEFAVFGKSVNGVSHIKKFGPVMDIGLKSVNDTCL